MNGAVTMSDYVGRLEAFRKSDSDRDALVQEVLRNFDELKIKYDETLNDYNNEVASRRMWQSKAATCEQSLAQFKQATGSNSFVMAIIDGDGAIFQDHLYQMGKDGGADSAQMIYAEIKNHLNAIYPDSNVADWSIVVQVILNLHGLAQKMLACGIISNVNDLAAFGRAFGLAQPLFSFVDVGNGKERADHKIRETLRLYLPNAQCRHVFFGPCNDNGYIPVLEPYRRDLATKSRLTLIETRPAEPGFAGMGLQIIRFPAIFRSDNLPMRPPPMFPPPPATTGAQMPTRTISGNPHAASTPFTAAYGKTVSPAPSVDSIGSVNNTVSNSWATVGKSGSAPKNISIAPAKTVSRRHFLTNAYDERLDPDLPKTDPGAESRFAERMKTIGKCCNNYHLTGECKAGKYCDYNHGERLSPGELLVLKHKARSRSCPNKSWCQDFDCTYGHHCKFGKMCPLDHCYFADTHGMDTTPAKRVFQDGSEEWIQAYLDQSSRK